MFKKYQLPLILMSFISFSTLALVITRMSPCKDYGSNQICSQSANINHIFLYLSLYIFIACLFASISFYLRVRNSDTEKINHHFNTSLRQGVLVSIFTTTSVFFLGLNILKWWTSIILLVLIILIEFMSLQKRST